MLRPGVWCDWRTGWYVVSNWRQMWSRAEFGSLCMTLTNQHSLKGIWWDWMWMATGRSGLQKPAIPILTVLMDTTSPPQYRTQTFQLPFTSNPTRSISKNASLLVSFTNCQIPPLTTFATSLKLHTNSSSNHVTSQDSTSVNPPYSTLAPVTLTVFCQSLLLYCWRRSQCLAEKLSSVSYLLSADPTTQTSCTALSPLLSYAFPGISFCYIESKLSVPMPTHCTIMRLGFRTRQIDGIKCGLFSNHAPLGQTTMHVGRVSV